MSKIGQRIRAARTLKGWTQHELATRLGMKRGRIAMWESDDSAPRAQDVAAVAKVLGLKARDLLP